MFVEGMIAALLLIIGRQTHTLVTAFCIFFFFINSSITEKDHSV